MDFAVVQIAKKWNITNRFAVGVAPIGAMPHSTPATRSPLEQ
jgi:hypothetical protein